MMRSQHYTAAEKLLHVYGPNDYAHDLDIPNLLRALTHAVLAAADPDTEISAHANASTRKGEPA